MVNQIKKIKVLLAIRQGLIGGGETHVLSLVEHIDKTLYTPIVLSFSDGPMVERLTSMGIPCHVIPSKRAFDVFAWKKVKQLIINEKIDVIHVHGSRAASNLVWPAKDMKKPLLYTIHGWSFHEDQNPIKKKLRIASEKILTRKSDLNISVSESNQRTGKHFIPDFRSIVIENGIDLQIFSPSNVRHKDEIRKVMGIPRDSILVTFIARMTKQKDPLSLIRAFHIVLRKYNNIHLLMIGEGELRKQAENLAKELIPSGHVTFDNFRGDVPDILGMSDIYCLPSLWEGLPIGLLEAMSMGKAVIATNVDGSKEIISNGQNGQLVSPGSTNELANAILNLCENSSKRKALAIEARQTIQNNFDVKKMSLKISDRYSELYAKSQLKNIQ